MICFSVVQHRFRSTVETVTLDVTDATFETEVIERSKTQPVVVDLWAPWCQPCKTLTPILEKVVAETNGKVTLAKVNVDENMQVSQAFRVQSIPAVYALSDGQVIDGFMGAQPEANVREFVQKLIGDDLDADSAALLAEGNEPALQEALKLNPGNTQIVTALARLLLDEQRHKEAIELVTAVKDHENDPQLLALLTEAREALKSNSDTASTEASLNELLTKVKTDEDAKAQFLSILEELSIADPTAAAEWRKKLSSALF